LLSNTLTLDGPKWDPFRGPSISESGRNFSPPYPQKMGPISVLGQVEGLLLPIQDVDGLKWDPIQGQGRDLLGLAFNPKILNWDPFQGLS